MLIVELATDFIKKTRLGLPESWAVGLAIFADRHKPKSLPGLADRRAGPARRVEGRNSPKLGIELVSVRDALIPRTLGKSPHGILAYRA